MLPLAQAGREARSLDVAWVQKAGEVSELALLGALPFALAAHDHDLTCIRTSRLLPLGHAPCHRPPGVACITFGCALVRDRRPKALVPLRLRSPFAARVRLAHLAERAPIVACSAYLKESLVAAGVAEARVRVVHPVPPEDLQPLSPRPEAPLLLAAGQLVRGKGLDLAIEALALLPEPTELCIAGDGPLRADLERLAARIAPRRVRFLGYLGPEAMSGLYDRASVVLMPSRWPEPFGLVGPEAMRRGRPVAGAAHGGIPEWLVEGSGFRPGDASDLARVVARLLVDRTAGDRALATVRARFSHDAAVDEVETLLAGLASGAEAAA